MASLPKALIIAPYWRKPQYVGVYRVERFVRWLSENETEVVVVRAGRQDKVNQTSWGAEIEIRDPLGKSWDTHPDAFTSVREGRLRGFLNSVSDWCLTPDSVIFWARRAARHSLVLEHGKGASFVLSSSPPESVHVAASRLAQLLDTELIIDLRDGWLDEPLKSYLQRNRLLRWREGMLEKRILKQARQIFATSDVWKEMLAKRLSFTKEKTTVLTNCYPQDWLEKPSKSPRSLEEKCTLLYAGSFTNSKFNNRPGLLLGPLWAGLPANSQNFQVVIRGNLSDQDLLEIDNWRGKFTRKGVEIIYSPPVARQELNSQIHEACGLLLLSATQASLLAKIFEYVPSRRPILAFTLQNSAMWRLHQEVPQIFAADFRDDSASREAVSNFLKACQTGRFESDVPFRFTEEHNRRIFSKIHTK